MRTPRYVVRDEKGRWVQVDPLVRYEQRIDRSQGPDACHIWEIRSSSDKGIDLAKRYGVSPQTVCDIQKGRRWKWLG